MVTYLALCAGLLLSGYGLLAALPTTGNRKSSFLAAPGISLALCVPVIVGATALGVPPYQTAIVLSGFLVLCAGLGAVRLVRSAATLDWRMVTAALLCAPILLAPFFYYGIDRYPGSWYWDGWNYIVHAQILADWPSPEAVRRSPLYFYAATFSGDSFIQTRLTSSSLLAYLAFLTASEDVRACVGLFFSMCVFVFSAGCGFLVNSIRPTKPIEGVGYVLLAGTGVWLLGAVQSNNFDSLVGLALSPVVTGLAVTHKTSSKAQAVVFGLAIVAVLYAQPELAPLMLMPAAMFFLQRMIAEPESVMPTLRWLAISLLAVFLGSLPWQHRLVEFFLSQLQAATDVLRPGEGFFPTLFDYRCLLPAVWGMWPPAEQCTTFLGKPYWNFAHLLSILLTLLLMIGVHRMWQTRQWFVPGAVGVSVAAAMIFLVFQKYDYAAYKFLVAAWFLSALLVMEGARVTAQALSRIIQSEPARMLLLGVVGMLILLTALIVLVAREVHFNRLTPVKNMDWYRGIRNIVPQEKEGGAYALAMSDPQALEWAMYYLRRYPVVPLQLSHPYIKSLLETNEEFKLLRREILSRANSIITDSPSFAACPGAKLMKRAGPYHLYRMPELGWAALSRMENPNNPISAEMSNGVAAIWIGDREVQFTVYATRPGTAFLDAEFVMGPSLAGASGRRLGIETQQGGQREIKINQPGRTRISFQVSAGENEVKLRGLDTPESPLPHPQDPRVMLVGVRDFNICLQHGVP